MLSLPRSPWRISPFAVAFLVGIFGTVFVVITRARIPGSLGAFLSTLSFLLTVVLAGCLGGWKPGLAATLLSVLAADVLLIKPYYTLKFSKAGDVLTLVAYFIVGVAISVLCEGLHIAWRRIEERQRELEEEVAERRRAELSEQEQAERLRVTLASIGDAVITTDATGRVTYLNGVAEQLTGWRQTDARGQKLGAIFRVFHETTRQPAEDPVAKVLQTGNVVGLAEHTVLVARDGTERPIDDSAAPIRDRSGAVGGVVMIFRDCTEQRRHTQRLQLLWETAAVLLSADDPQAMWHSLFEKIGPPLQLDAYFNFMVDETGETVRLESQGGLAPSGFPSPAPEFPRAACHVEDRRNRFTAGNSDTCDEPSARFAESQRLAVHSSNPLMIGDRLLGIVTFGRRSAVPFSDDDAEFLRTISHYATMAHERIRLLRELRDSDRRKDQFLATLAHELRNPLAPISNALQLWPRVEHDREEMTQLHEMMERQVQQIIRLIDDLLDVSRITRGKIELRKQTVSLTTVLEGALEAIRPFIETCNQHLTVTLPSAPILVEGDIARLSQVFANILHNAAKYTGRDGSISVSAVREDGQAVVRIKDNGPGIPRHMLAEVFEMFAQVDQTLERSHGGLGIGLTLAKNLIQLHGGSIEACSEGPEKGSEFIVRLPALGAVSADSTPKERRGPERNLSGLPRHKVLVVDDVRASAKTLGMMLASIGQDVVVKDGGAQAIDAAVTDQPQIAFIDIAMPGMNGYEVARHLKKHPNLQGLVLVALTGYGQDEDRRQAFEAGFDHHMVKPASIEALQQLLLSVPASTASQ